MNRPIIITVMFLLSSCRLADTLAGFPNRYSLTMNPVAETVAVDNQITYILFRCSDPPNPKYECGMMVQVNSEQYGSFLGEKRNLMQIILHIGMFEELEYGSVMYKGEGLYYPLYDKPVKWIAKKGSGPDWAIYYGHRHWSDEQVLKQGEKVFTESVIRTLVPCDDETFRRYRK